MLWIGECTVLASVAPEGDLARSVRDAGVTDVALLSIEYNLLDRRDGNVFRPESPLGMAADSELSGSICLCGRAHEHIA